MAAAQLSKILSVQGKYDDLPRPERIKYASKKNMNPDGTVKNPRVNYNSGIADLVSHPPIGWGFSQVWEVKSYSQRAKATSQAQWYTNRINENDPDRQASVGQDYMIFASVPGFADTYVWSQGPGAIIYGTWDEYKKDTNWSEEKLHQSQQKPPAEPKPPAAPPPGPGLVDILGLGLAVTIGGALSAVEALVGG